MLEQTLPRIALLATGGTIAGTQVQANSAGYKAGALPIGHLVDAVPGLSNLARIQAEQVANIGSQNMSHDVWGALAARIADLSRQEDIKGIVVVHGTDTLEETAYFLSLVTHTDKPLVLVGAMRPATALGAEGPANLYNAVALAVSAQARGRGPLVVMNEDIHYAREVQKIASMGICAFASPNRGRAGVVRGGEPRFYSRNTTRHTLDSEFSLSALQAAHWPRVDIVYAHAGMDGLLIDALAGHAAGIVLAGVGGGNTTDSALSALSRAAAAGVAVVRSSRTGSGPVDRGGEVDDDAMNFVAAGELSPQKARVLLMLALSVGRDPAQWQRCFEQY
ncbi:asparaginase [Bordetella sp. FB-8]|uniref:asparaginase n=1 Tax=Bordetella sp. FB-8 TaxID=1159870 RepID=UPI0003A1EBDC|nr:asparaginase [Bordetella sp. FB-8]